MENEVEEGEASFEENNFLDVEESGKSKILETLDSMSDVKSESNLPINVWVKGLSHDIQVNEIKELFDQYGKVIDVKIISTSKQDSSTIALISMPNIDASECVKQLNNYNFKGNTLSLTLGEKSINVSENKDISDEKILPNTKKEDKEPKSFISRAFAKKLSLDYQNKRAFYLKQKRTILKMNEKRRSIPLINVKRILPNNGINNDFEKATHIHSPMRPQMNYRHENNFKTMSRPFRTPANRNYGNFYDTGKFKTRDRGINNRGSRIFFSDRRGYNQRGTNFSRHNNSANFPHTFSGKFGSGGYKVKHDNDSYDQALPKNVRGEFKRQNVYGPPKRLREYQKCSSQSSSKSYSSSPKRVNRDQRNLGHLKANIPDNDNKLDFHGRSSPRNTLQFETKFHRSEKRMFEHSRSHHHSFQIRRKSKLREDSKFLRSDTNKRSRSRTPSPVITFNKYRTRDREHVAFPPTKLWKPNPTSSTPRIGYGNKYVSKFNNLNTSSFSSSPLGSYYESPYGQTSFQSSSMPTSESAMPYRAYYNHNYQNNTISNTPSSSKNMLGNHSDHRQRSYDLKSSATYLDNRYGNEPLRNSMKMAEPKIYKSSAYESKNIRRDDRSRPTPYNKSFHNHPSSNNISRNGPSPQQYFTKSFRGHESRYNNKSTPYRGRGDFRKKY